MYPHKIRRTTITTKIFQNDTLFKISQNLAKVHFYVNGIVYIQTLQYQSKIFYSLSQTED